MDIVFIVMHDYIFENMNGGIQMLNFEEELKIMNQVSKLKRLSRQFIIEILQMLQI